MRLIAYRFALAGAIQRRCPRRSENRTVIACDARHPNPGQDILPDLLDKRGGLNYPIRNGPD